MGADALEAGFLESVAEVCGSFVEVAGGFDFFVSGSGELVECSLEVFGQEVPHRIELQADGLLEGPCREGIEADQRSGGECAGSFEKGAARAGFHLVCFLHGCQDFMVCAEESQVAAALLT